MSERPAIFIYADLDLTGGPASEIVWDDQTGDESYFDLNVRIRVALNTKVFIGRQAAFALYSQRLRSRISKRLRLFRFSSVRPVSPVRVQVLRGSILVAIAAAVIWTYKERRENFLLMVEDVERLINFVSTFLRKEERRARADALTQAPARTSQVQPVARRIEEKATPAATVVPATKKPVKLKVVYQGQRGSRP